MPTYTNNTTAPIYILGSHGITREVAPGATLATKYFCDHAANGLTKDSDAPLYNRVKARHTVTLTDVAQDVEIDLETTYVAVVQITGAITAYCQSVSNTPPELEDWTSDDPIVQIPAAARFTKLVVTGYGTCEIIEYV